MKADDIWTVTRTITQQDFDRFATLTGDDNPIHVDPEFCAATRFGKTLCHGMFLFGLIQQAVRAKSPKARLIEQALKFPGPAFAGDELRIDVATKRVEDAPQIVQVSAVITGPNGVVCCESQSLLQLEGP